MKLLVTGGSGGIGAYVVAELAQAGHTVTSFDRALPREQVPGVSYRIGDHEDLGQLVELSAGTDAIVHLSAIPTPRTYPNLTVFRTNVIGQFNAHEAAAICGVPLVVSTSSQSAYGFAYQHRPFLPRYLPLDEDHPDLSQDAYGLSKMVGEEIAHTFHRRNGLRVCNIRPPWVVTPTDYQSHVHEVLQDPDEWSGFLFAYVDVRDLAVVYRLVAEASPEQIQDAVFNVVADDALAKEPLATLLPRIHPPFGDMAASLTGRQSMVTAERLKRTLGWQPQHSWRDSLPPSVAHSA